MSWTSSHFNRPTGSGIALRSSRLLAAANTKPTSSTYTPRSSLAAKFAARDKPSTSRTTKTDYGATTRSTSETTRPSSTPRASTFSISFTNKLPETTRRTNGRLTTDLKAPEPTSSRTSSSTARTIVGTAGSDYLRTRRKPDDISSASSSRSLTTKMAGVPEVISRFGSRSPAFLAGGVVRTTAPSYSASRPSRFSTSSPTSPSPAKPIRKEERPWRVRMAEQSRLRDLETPTISFTTAGGATSIVTRTRPTNTEISKTAVKESTPVSSLGLRNYESKFSNRYSASPVSSISSAYSPSKYRHSVPVGRLSRNSSTASSTLSLYSQVNSPRYLSPTFAHGSVSQARQSSLMTRSLYTPSLSSYHPPPSRMSQSYTASELKRMGEGTKWTPVEPKGIPEERRSRDPEKTPKARSRSVSKKRRSRSRSVANEPPPPASSSDSANENENGKVEKRKKLRKKSSASNIVPTFATTPNTTKSPVNKPKTTKMPANFEGQLPNEPKSEVSETITAKSTPLIKTDPPNKNETEFHAVTTFKPAGALKKKKILEETSNKPVPGVWNGENEVFISCNKSLLRKESKIQIEVVMKHIPHSKAPIAYFKVQKKRRIVIMSRNKIVNASFMKPRVHSQTVTLTLKDKHAIQKSVAKLNVKEPKKAVKIEEKTINEHLVKNKQMKLNVEKKWSEKKRSIAQKLALKCKAVSEKMKTVNMNINRRPEQKACNGTVRLPAEARRESVQLSILQPMNVAVTLAQPPKIIEILSPERIEWSDGFSSPELYERELHVPLPPKHQPGGPLVLPDQSTLEEYVKRKRNHLETIRIYNSPVEKPDKNSVNDTGAEARRADSNMTPRPNDPVQIIQPAKVSPAPPAAPAGLLRAMLRKASDPSGSNRLQPMKAVFDTPKSPFEEKMQQQANKLRQAEAEEPKADNKWKRRSMDSDLAQGFQALAAQHSNKPAERYAAHIPINVPSGRQSVASVESVQSVALDKASQQLDQMIDQARYKHQQHRTKFKEAIDYLDQIFEDLKKETVEPSKKPTERTIQKPEKFPVGNQLQAKNSLKSQPKTTSPQRPQLVKSVSQDGGSNVRIHPQKQPQPARFQQTAQQKAPSAAVQKANAVNAQFKSSAQRPRLQKATAESGDVEVTETIVLPSKNSAERLDYTRKWLQDDIKTWVDKPGSGPLNNQIRRVGSSGESDEEHSLGSCSAEVAAINAAKREKRDKQAAKDKKTKNEPVSQPPPPPVQVQQPIHNGAPIKPRPYRPNEQGAPGFVITESYDLQKVNSHGNIRPSTSDSVDRAASSHEYSGGSQNSHDGKPAYNSLQRTASGAFVQFQRGSIQSLPDAIYGPTRTPQPYPPSNTSGYGSTSSQQYLHPPDPVHQMNALVAELELNTDPNFEKRRSFPTIQVDPQKSPRQRPIANTTVKVQNPLPDPHSRLNVPQNTNYSGSMDRGMRRYEQEKDPLQTSVQRPAAQSSTLAQKLAPKQKLEDATSLLDSVIGELHPLDGPKRPKATDQYYNQNNNVSQPSWQQQMMMKKQQRMAQSQVQHQNNQIGGVHVHQHQPGHVHIPQMGIRNEHQPNHFQTINEEKLNPSKVEKIHNLFEQTRGPRSVQRQGSREHPPEPVYSEISEFRHERSSSLKTNTLGRLNPSQVDRPSLPSTQPPNQPRGYLSPTQKTPQVQRQGSLRRPPPQPFDRVSLNSQNIEEEENFYDNIRTHRQDDEQSVTSRRTIGAPYLASRSPQPQATQKNAQGGRIGHLIRKLGGVPERPIVHQTSVHEGSVMSLNRVGQEQSHQPQRPGVLMKSNSLSGEPWRIHAIDKEDSSLDQKTSGIGNRLKQTLFGSRKWLNN
ncbi:unnamed protein product [Bursaphelenchus xylophilus]|uniref:(pine wood nematode) hypothetical protein n=1 Tax=Bursaphelenchus xylophilus TaxID=6326 RepID=A0A1I7S7Q2_BURXY|nr:unnamed protein product [Bursaphelenchus xylophilus]CAG9086848.1 unnamed protein product [Bursaphelenchus xylophilus]